MGAKAPHAHTPRPPCPACPELLNRAGWRRAYGPPWRGAARRGLLWIVDAPTRRETEQGIEVFTVAAAGLSATGVVPRFPLTRQQTVVVRPLMDPSRVDWLVRKRGGFGFTEASDLIALALSHPAGLFPARDLPSPEAVEALLSETLGLRRQGVLRGFQFRRRDLLRLLAERDLITPAIRVFL